MEDPSPINTGSTQSRRKCEACRVQKLKCHPVYRDWNKGEKCNRCQKFGLSCGSNLTIREQRKRLARFPKHDVDDQGEDEACSPSLLSSPSASTVFENELSCMIFSNGENATSDHEWLSTPTFGQGGTQFNSYTTEEGRAGRESSFKEVESKESELWSLLRDLDLRAKEWLSYQTVLSKSQEANQNSGNLMLQMWQVPVSREIKFAVGKVESFADEADCNGRRCHAYMAYTRLIDKLEQIGDRAGKISVLSKLAKLQVRNKDYIQSEETLRILLNQDQVAGPDRDDWKTMLAESCAKSALGIAGLSLETKQYPDAEFGNPGLNLENLCPDFHLAVQDEAPPEVPSMILSRQRLQDPVDVVNCPRIHRAIELGRQDIVEELLRKMPTSVHIQDSAQRTPLQLTVQFRCEHRTNLQCPRTTICPLASACILLLSAGAERNARDATGCTTLTSAARAGCPFICRDLLVGIYPTEAANINPTLSYGQSSPLQAAAEEGNDDVVDILLTAGAKASAIRHDGKTAYELAKDRGHRGIMRQLKQALEEEERGVLHNQFNRVGVDPFMGRA